MIFDFLKKKENRKKEEDQARSYTKNIVGRDEFINTVFQDEEYASMHLDKLRAVSRERARTNSIISAYSKLGENNVVGKGFGLKISKRQNFPIAKKTEENIIKRWADFCKAENFDSSGVKDLNEYCRLLTKTLLIDGECLTKIIREEPNEQNKYGLQYQSIDVNRLDTNKNADNIRKGVEFNKRGRPVRYYLRQSVESPLGLLGTKYTPSGCEDAENIIHIFKQNYPEQSRGVPFTAPALGQIKQLEAFEKITMKAAYVGTLLSVYIKKNEVDHNDINNLETGQVNDIALSSGGIYQLQNGESIEGFKGDYPSELYNSFVFNKIKLIARSLGLTPTFLANEWAGANYAIARFMSNEDRQFYETLQTFIIEHFLNKVFKEFLKSLVLNFDFPPKIIDLQFDFIPSVFAEIDAVKTQTAKNAELKALRKSFSELAAEEGKEFSDVIAQYKSDLETISQNFEIEKSEVVGKFLENCFK